MRTGMTTVTFRKMDVAALIMLARQAGLDGLEWGGDVHVPPGQAALAKEVRARCEDAGLAVLSYGSYYRGEAEGFEDVLRTAVGLGAKQIRAWAGTLSPDKADDVAFSELSKNLNAAVRLAAAEGIRVSLEYHRNTMTERIESALRLLNAVPGLRSYWQPNPDIGADAHVREIQGLGDRLTNVHVFAWTAGNVRHPLEQGAAAWARYVEAIRALGGEHDFILEFVKDESPEQLLTDARTLSCWLGKS